MAQILQVRKGVIFGVAQKGRRVVKTFTKVHKMPRYLLIYSKISLWGTWLTRKAWLLITILAIYSPFWREKGKRITKIVVKSHAFLLDRVLFYWNLQFIILKEVQRLTHKQSIFSVYNGVINVLQFLCMARIC